ncbi:MAG: helix-turn-helix domain-containing protein [Methanomicrobiales archaeon]|jgi:predicted transcriptional regulator|nr:helix-turn-helix domain-containing protein [Methanomicrobiales archaeon]
MAAEKGDLSNRSRIREDKTTQILDLLKEETRGLSISDISRRINLNRSSTARYLGVLMTAGRVEMYVIGSAKVYRISSRPSLLEVFNHIQESVIVIDSDLTVRGINPACCTHFGLTVEETVDRAAASVSSAFLEKLVTSETFIRAIRGTERVSETLTWPGAGGCYLATYIPVMLSSGRYGVAITFRDAPAEGADR